MSWWVGVSSLLAFGSFTSNQFYFIHIIRKGFIVRLLDQFFSRHVTMGSCETVPDLVMRSGVPAKHELLVSSVRPLISNFLETIDYAPPQNPDKGALRASMLEYAATSGVPYNEDRHARQCFLTGLSVAGVRTKFLHPMT